MDAWNENYVESALAENPHVAEHLKTLTRLVAGGRYDIVTDQLETLLGRRPKTVRWALENHPRIRKVAAAQSNIPTPSPEPRYAVSVRRASQCTAGGVEEGGHGRRDQSGQGVGLDAGRGQVSNGGAAR